MKYLSPDKEFKKIALNIGTCLLIFLGMYEFLFNGLYSIIILFLPHDNVIAETVSEILYGIIYLSVFIVPAVIYRAMSKKTDLHPLKIFKPIPRSSFPFLFLAISIGFTCSYVTSIILSFFELPEYFLPSTAPSGPMTLLQFFLAVFTTAIVPAICEELLFRSTILENLLPYGKGFAIFTSALLFGLMHQNFFQIFYTTMAGLIIGWAYCKTRSYLCVFLIHFCNNFIGVLEELITSNLSQNLATLICGLMESIIFSLGILCAIIIAIKEKKKKDIYADGSFGRLFETSENYKEKKLSFDAAKTFFRSPTVLIFTILVIVTIAFQVLLMFIPIV